MINYNYTTTYNANLLEKKIKEQSYGSTYLNLSSIGNQLTLIFSEELAIADKEHLDDLMIDHSENFLSSFDFIFESSRVNQQENINFGQTLLYDWMRMNILEGMSVKQSLWVFSRFEDFEVSCDFGNKKVDIFKMFQSGAIPTVYYCILQVEPDPMTEDYHWITTERMQWVKDRVVAHIGPGMAAYIESLLPIQEE
jgi:hypothetical protein